MEGQLQEHRRHHRSPTPRLRQDGLPSRRARRSRTAHGDAIIRDQGRHAGEQGGRCGVASQPIYPDRQEEGVLVKRGVRNARCKPNYTTEQEHEDTQPAVYNFPIYDSERTHRSNEKRWEPLHLIEGRMCGSGLKCQNRAGKTCDVITERRSISA
jgi:hypothetical protein